MYYFYLWPVTIWGGEPAATWEKDGAPLLHSGKAGESIAPCCRDQWPNGTSELGGLRWLLRKGYQLIRFGWVLRDGRAQVSIWHKWLFKDVTLWTVDKRSHGSKDVLPGALDPCRVQDRAVLRVLKHLCMYWKERVSLTFLPLHNFSFSLFLLLIIPLPLVLYLLYSGVFTSEKKTHNYRIKDRWPKVFNIKSLTPNKVDISTQLRVISLVITNKRESHLLATDSRTRTYKKY